MAFWSRFLRMQGRKDSGSVYERWLELLNGVGGRQAKSGQVVNAHTALRVTTVLACARVIAEGISQVPLKLYRESPDGRTRVPAKDHPLYDLLHRRPNYSQTSYQFRESMGMHLSLAGNAYAYINRLRNKQIGELVQFEPGWVNVKRNGDGSKVFGVTLPGGERQDFAQEDIWHVPGPAWCNYIGLEPIVLAREAIGLALATEEQHAKLHANGVQPSGVYSVEGTLTKEQYPALKDWLKKAVESGDPLLLDRGAKWVSQAMSGVDAQHLETRGYQVEEICRALRVMPIMVGHSDKAATYASAEQMFLAHVVHTLSPWYERIEQSIDAYLLTDRDTQAGIYAKFLEEGLLRGSLEATADYLQKLKAAGFITTNEGRAQLDLNPDPDPESDKIQQPANIVGGKQTPDAGGASASKPGA